MLRALGAAVVTLTCTGCPGSTATPAGPVKATPNALAASYQWEASSQSPGVLRHERESWTLKEDREGQVRGTIAREVRFISTDGQPFRCIQGPSYRLQARYTLSGKRLPGGRLQLEERDVKVKPGPCEKGTRPLQQYDGQVISSNNLRVTWAGGSQLLRAGADPPSPASQAISGRWTWSTEEELDDGARRRESEAWAFSPLSDHKLKGSYERRVELSYRDGRQFSCASATSYAYTDRYEFVASRVRNVWTLQETRYESAVHPCLTSTERLLDSARIRLFDDVLLVEWRGKKLQVLHQ